jgi:predicted RNA methylase
LPTCPKCHSEIGCLCGVLTRRQRREVIVEAVKANPHRSSLSIAQECGVTDKTVQAVKKEMAANSEIPNSSIRHHKLEQHDFYTTPRETVEALLKRVRFRGDVWEPCCGTGSICRVLEEHGHAVLATDLLDRGFGTGGVDFLKTTRRVDNIITNPPWTNGAARAFARHALECATKKVAMLVPLAMLAGIGSHRLLWRDHPPATVFVLSKRPAFRRRGVEIHCGERDVAWFVWERGHKEKFFKGGWIV